MDVDIADDFIEEQGGWWWVRTLVLLHYVTHAQVTFSQQRTRLNFINTGPTNHELPAATQSLRCTKQARLKGS